jgi:hypothetical protein
MAIMAEVIPAALLTAINEPVLAYVAARYAHSDISEALIKCVQPLDDVHVFCPDGRAFRYVVVSTINIIFGIAVNVHDIGFRVSPSVHDRALASGAESIEEIGPEWIQFYAFRPGWQNVDLRFWAERAYAFARGQEQ